MLSVKPLITKQVRYWFPLLGALLLGACAALHPYQGPNAAAPNLYRGAGTADTASIATMPWRAVFADAPLQKLLEEGLSQNLDLRIAVTRIQRAQANLAQSRAQFLPSLSARGSATESRSNNNTGVGTITGTGTTGTGTTGTGTGTGTGGTGTGGTGTGTGGTGTGGTGTGTTGTGTNDPNAVVTSQFNQQYLLTLSSSWEADIWGKLRSNKRSYVAALLQSEAYRRAVQTQLIANIADDYYLLLAYDEQLAITRQTVQNRIKDVETTKLLKDAAILTGAAVAQSEANLYAAQVSIPDLERNIRETENTISLLLNRAPGPIERSTLAAQTQPALLQTGVPGQLLRNRPDVQEAEAAYRSYFEQTNAARAYFYPSFTITANGGLTNTSVRDLFSPNALFGTLVGGLVQPIFNQGLNRARLRNAQGFQDEYLLTYQQTLLNAGQEVSNALFAYQTAGEKVAIRTNQLASLQRAVDFTQELVKYSSATYTDVLTSQQSLLAAQLSSINDRLQQLQATTDLYQALGGGWR
ncbi:efflux transporter outer membrane subunit [Hymenobacter caeli]|uniref:NodT family efflux transporter outer membrane factor (OMF) lipoprotein n=1 Tax=Hymenobacter caeli TaxID=2735894 RepID=A0ABX2FTD1_9BACT|nr:efflux transporter outer membrane subunit [Hymenobacter caeli]NRT20103.1 NodT family efflux transporter outer membrane factor (OMF) lipoprotein [Hymenobacter caeli]